VDEDNVDAEIIFASLKLGQLGVPNEKDFFNYKYTLSDMLDNGLILSDGLLSHIFSNPANLTNEVYY
jgi:hypothetical protein